MASQRQVGQKQRLWWTTKERPNVRASGGALPGAIVGGLLGGYGLSYASGKLTESTINYMNKWTRIFLM